MGLKYKDPVTGEYKRYNFPIIKGEKGDKGEPGAGGIHVGVEAPTDPNINLWFKPNDGINDVHDSVNTILNDRIFLDNFEGGTKAERLINAIKFATTNGCKEVFIPSGEYIMPERIELPQNFQHVSLRGENTKTTILNFEGVNGICIKAKGGSGNFSHAMISNLTIKGNGSTVGIQLCDTNGFYVDNCRFENHAVGVEFYNEQGFTEYSIVRYSDFTSSCQSAVKFSVNDGNQHVSMHGSGLEHVTINQSESSTQSPIIIGSRALVYNSPLSFSIWTRSSVPVIQHNGDRSSYTFGQICNETFGTNTVNLCEGYELFHMGCVSSWGKQLEFGKFIPVESMKLSDGKRLYNRKPFIGFNGAITNTITHIANCQCDMLLNICIVGAFYRYQATLLVGKNVQADNLTITTLQEHSVFDQLGKGKVTFDSVRNDVRVVFPALPEYVNCKVSVTPLTLSI